jgi:hypothetical protein
MREASRGLGTGVKGRPRRLWLVQRYDGLERTFRTTLPVGYLTDVEMIALLKRLAAKELTTGEVIAASLRKSARNYVPLLEVRRESRSRLILSVGENPHYVASVHTEAELRDIDQVTDPRIAPPGSAL